MVGAVIAGKYRIESLIGSGGMANVYKAYDEQEGRTVAIKMLKTEHREDTEFLRRFEREAKAVITLSHPNIVQSYDVGVDEKGVSFIVLEYVHGQTLKDYIKSKTYLSPKEAVDIAAKVLDALGHDPATLDALCARTGWSAQELSARLLELELEDRVARLPGGLYQRRSHA